MGGRFTGLALCALLIPIKLIAVTFAPALLFGDLVDLKPAAFFRDRWREVVLGLLLWSLGFGAVLLHNHYSLQGVTPESYISSSVEMMMGEIKRFCGGFFRQGVAIWYGSIRNWWVLVPFCLVAALGLGCLATMVRNGAGRRLLIIGSAVFGMSWMMELYRVYYAGPRLMGYGMVLMLLGAVPRPRFAVLWISYTTAVALLTGYNFATVNSVGLNAPMYEQAAKEVATVLPSTPAVIHTNTWHLLDVHAGRASALAPNVDALPSGSLFWHVDLPNYDAIARIITDQTPPNWPMIGKLEHGGLYQKP